MIKEIIDWNKKAGNTNFDKHLEASMLSEEFSETIIALKNGDDIELIDGVIDTFIVGVGTLYKRGITAKQIEDCFEEIIRSNDSKFEDGIVVRDKGGKIIKPKTFSPANLKDIIYKK